MLAWGKKVSADFANRVTQIGSNLGVDPNFLMACMAFESGESFSASVRNAAGSGAVGLIQFMPTTAQALGTSTDQLAAMSNVQQLDFVEKYFLPSKGRLQSLEDVYMAILWPAAIGKPLDYVLFDKNDAAHPKRYVQNAGLDLDKNGQITKGETASKIRDKLNKGLLPDNAG
ncbi:hypothetical protein JCM19000A_21960 [Silvimonas sp. JCM 19000]